MLPRFWREEAGVLPCPLPAPGRHPRLGAVKRVCLAWTRRELWVAGVFREVSPEFVDLIYVDVCRGELVSGFLGISWGFFR